MRHRLLLNAKGPILSAALLSTVAGAARADPFPFAEGVPYDYEYVIQMGSGSYRRVFAGTAVVGGANVRVQHFEGGADDGLQAYWSESPEGDKYFHGSHMQRFGGEPILWDPPILMLDTPLFVGKTWSVDTQESGGLAARVDFEVVALDDVTVPAGTFQAFTVQDTWHVPEAARALAHAGRLFGIPGPVGSGKVVYRRSYADEVGLILHTWALRTDRLVAMNPVGIEPATWTRIRGLYR